MNNKAKIDCVDHESRTNETVPSVAVESVSVEKRQGVFEERPLPVNEIAPRVLRYRTRRDFILSGLARWRRWQAVDFSCHRIRSVAWVCVEL
jgi:hypothetical protein